MKKTAFLIIKEIIIIIILYYTLVGVMLVHNGWHPISLEKNPNPRTGRTHYWIFRPAGMYELNSDLFDIGIPITVKEDSK